MNLDEPLIKKAKEARAQSIWSEIWDFAMIDGAILINNIPLPDSSFVRVWDVESEELKSYFKLLVQIFFEEDCAPCSNYEWKKKFARELNKQILHTFRNCDEKKSLQLALLITHPQSAIKRLENTRLFNPYISFKQLHQSFKKLWKKHYSEGAAWVLTAKQQSSNPIRAELGDLKTFWHNYLQKMQDKEKEILRDVVNQKKVKAIQNCEQHEKVLTLFSQIVLKEAFSWKRWRSFYVSTNGVAKLKQTLITYDIQNLKEEEFAHLFVYVIGNLDSKIRSSLVTFISSYLKIIVRTTLFLNTTFDFDKLSLNLPRGE